MHPPKWSLDFSPQLPCWAALQGTCKDAQSIAMAAFSCVVRVASILLLRRCSHLNNVLLWLVDDDVVWQRHLGTHLSLRVVRKHDLDHDTKNALTHEDVAARMADVVTLGLTCRDKVAILELHRFRALGSKLSADDDLATLGAILHDETDNAVACTAHGQASQELVTQGLCLGTSASSTVLNTLSEELHTIFWEAIALLDNRRQLPDATTLLSQNLKLF